MKHSLEDQIIKNLYAFTNEIQKGLEQDIDDVTKEGIKKLKTKSPKLTGDYAKGWSFKRIGDSTIVIYNKKKPSLTHLLEKGTVHSKAKVHIKPIEEWIIEEIETRTIKRLKS